MNEQPVGAPDVDPDTKDWTWVLDRPCPECGLVAADVEAAELGPRLLDNASAWLPVLAAPGSATRPRADVWSPTEYACHVRDVHRVFATRVRLMLEVEDPEFANWDQDATAVAERYDLVGAEEVGPALVSAAGEAASLYDVVPDHQWARTGRRDNGSSFTVLSLGRYHLHDVVHHLHDVGAG